MSLFMESHDYQNQDSSHFSQNTSQFLPRTPSSQSSPLRPLSPSFSSSLKVVAQEVLEKLKEDIQTAKTQISQLDQTLHPTRDGGMLSSMRRICSFVVKIFDLKTINQMKLERENLDRKSSELDEKAKSIEKFVLDSEDPSAVFTLENRVRNIVEHHSLVQEKYVAIYQDKIIPLLEQAKSELTKRRYHFSVQGAADQGKALQAGLRVLNEKEFIQQNVRSAQMVSVLKEQKAVLKIGDKKSVEDEQIMNALFTIRSKEGVKGAFYLQNPSFKKFGIEKGENRELFLKGNVKNQGDEIKPINKIAVKSYANMILISDLKKQEQVKEEILKRLSPQSQFNVIQTGELQFLDLHANNVGVAPELNKQHKVFKNLQFETALGSMNFNDLIIRYLAKDIDESTMIEYTRGDTRVKKPLRELTHLHDALESPWKLVLFDLDVCLAEDNRFQYQLISRSNKKDFLIPLRSTFLSTQWKDQPLSEETIQELMQSDEIDKETMKYIGREDAPIYKLIPQGEKEKIQEELNPIIQKYRLSQKENQNFTIEELRKEFVDDLKRQQQLWDRFQILPYIVDRVQTDDNRWEQLAKCYETTTDELKKLNPKLPKRGDFIHLPSKFITSSSENADRIRGKYAKQLFPRLTAPQQTALLERMQHRKEYLIHQKALTESSLQGKDLLNQMKEFIENSSTPLSFLRRENYRKRLEEQESKGADSFFHSQTLQDIQKIKTDLAKECQPTYFNLMKAMYPFLGDAYELSLAVFQDPLYAGDAIGRDSLSSIIEDAKKFDQQSDVYRLAEYIEKQIHLTPNPSFFKKW